MTVDRHRIELGVTGGGTYHPLDLYVGYNGTATFTISNGGAVTSPVGAIGSQSGSVGTVTVTGTGSSWTIGNGTIYGGGLTVGDAGNGTLTVASGATVSATDLTVANGTGTQGAVTVTGSGSTLSSPGQTIFGYYGEATVTITDGGKITGGNTTSVTMAARTSGRQHGEGHEHRDRHRHGFDLGCVGGRPLCGHVLGRDRGHAPRREGWDGPEQGRHPRRRHRRRRHCYRYGDGVVLVRGGGRSRRG